MLGKEKHETLPATSSFEQKWLKVDSWRTSIQRKKEESAFGIGESWGKELGNEK